MARKKNEVARVVIGPTVLPETKAAIKRLAVDGLSAGEVIDRAVAAYDEAEPVPAEKPMDDSVVLGDVHGREIKASPWALSELNQIANEFRSEPKAALDMVIDYWRAGAIGQGKEAVATSSAVPSTLAATKECFCEHHGEPFMAPRFTTICPGCEAAGHSGDVRDCAACNAAGAL